MTGELQAVGRFFSKDACPRQNFTFRQFAKAALAAALVGVVSHSARAAPINFTVDFDLVDVTGIAGPGGSTILSATAIGKGPFETRNGPGPVDFPMIDVGDVIANNLSPRYFGSDAAPIGSLIANETNFKWGGTTFEPVSGVAIGGFEVQVAQPSTSSIVSAGGGNAFKHVSLSRGGKSVIFSDGDILNEFPPGVGQTEVMLWSGITPMAPQPTTTDVWLTTATIPPNPNGPFANLELVGQAFAVPEPSAMLLSFTGLLGLAFILHRRRRHP